MNETRQSLHILGVIFISLLAQNFAFAQESIDTTPRADEPPPIPNSLVSPRATMETFLGAMRAVRDGKNEKFEQAIAALDLSEISPLVRAEKGRDLAWILQEVIDRTRKPDLNRFSERTIGEPFVFQIYKNGKIEIDFTEHQGWRFSSGTIAALPALLDELPNSDKAKGTGEISAIRMPLHLQLRGVIPSKWKEQGLILERWQWIAIFIIVLLGTIIDKLVAVLLRLGVKFWRTRYAKGSFRNISDAILRPFGLMAMAFTWWAGLNTLGLAAEVLVILLISVKFLAALSTVWAAYRLVDLLAAFLHDAAAKTESKLDDAVVPLVTKTMKVFVTVMGAVFIADNLNIDVTSLLAGLGLGGLAFALAAKDVAGNLFGSVTVLLDQTFNVGDWVIIGDVEGSVEHIGFRSTRIRTFYNSLVSVPNSNLITANVDNMGKRSYRRLSCKMSLAYNTPPDRIDAFCEGVRELVRQHPYTRKDYFHVYLNEFSASALEVLVYVFWQTPEWGTELRERHRFLVDCLRIAKRLGVEFAYPTQTLYMRENDGELPAPEVGEFSPPQSEQDAIKLGSAEARSVVAATLGLGVIPPPADTADGGQEDDSE